MPRILQLLILVVLPCLARAAWAESADLVILGGQIVTVDPNLDTAEALAAAGGRLVHVGDAATARAMIADHTEVIELGDEMVMPGFIESHAHFVGMGTAAMSLNLGRARNWAEIVEMARAAAADAQPGEWIFGRGWHQEKWNELPDGTVEGCPTHQALSAATPHNPVLFTHASGHMAIANAAALRLAKVTSETPDPDGGQIVRDQRGQPTGVLRERAQMLASTISQEYRSSKEQTIRAIEMAAAECLSKGVTSFQDAGSSFATVGVIKEVAEQRGIPLRLWIMIRDSNANLQRLLPKCRTIDDPPRVTVRAVKRSLDGALGAHGAWLLEPYDDMPSSAGLNTYPLDDLDETARIALQHDCQLCVHAIGDRANQETLDLFERHLAGDVAKRWRIEHAQHLHEADIPRFSQLGVIASMQGIHCTSDAVFVIQRLGLRRAGEGAYVWRKLLDSGATIANGTDAPVEDVDPIASFHASVTRELSDGTRFFPRQAMTRSEALKSYTINAAYAAFEENEKGSLTTGKLADIVILSKNLLTCADAEIRGAEVQYTIVGGKIAYRRQE